MAWLELRLDTNAEEANLLEDALLASGAQAVTYSDAGDQPILEPGVGEMPLWPEIVLVALYEDSIDTDSAIAEIQKLHAASLPKFRWEILEDRIWEREWLKHHKPVSFGGRFWVFHEQVQDNELPTLLLDPGLAFGTGSHPTTALCLDWISKQDWAEKKLIDYGCGSGILGIAAAMLGGHYIQFTDIDPQALSATEENAQRNKIGTEQFDLYLAGQEPEFQADMLVANILAGPLVELAPTLSSKLCEGGLICLSGILADQQDMILNAYSFWFDDLQTNEQDGWLHITGARKNI